MSHTQWWHLFDVESIQRLIRILLKMIYSVKLSKAISKRFEESQKRVFTFSWDALERYRALQETSSGLRGLLVAAYLLLFPMVALVTSCRRVTLWERKPYSGGTYMLPLIVLTLQRHRNWPIKNHASNILSIKLSTQSSLYGKSRGKK